MIGYRRMAARVPHPSGADCKQWLEGAISWLNSYQPQTLIVVADSLPGNNQAIGQLGFIELLKALDIPGRRLIVMGPQPTGNVYGGAPCLSAHPSNIQTCGAPLAQLVNPTDFSAVKNSALSVGATYINPVPWMCTATTCPPVIDSYPVQEDPSTSRPRMRTILLPSSKSQQDYPIRRNRIQEELFGGGSRRCRTSSI